MMRMCGGGAATGGAAGGAAIAGEGALEGVGREAGSEKRRLGRGQWVGTAGRWGGADEAGVPNETEMFYF